MRDFTISTIKDSSNKVRYTAINLSYNNESEIESAIAYSKASKSIWYKNIIPRVEEHSGITITLIYEEVQLGYKSCLSIVKKFDKDIYRLLDLKKKLGADFEILWRYENYRVRSALRDYKNVK